VYKILLSISLLIAAPRLLAQTAQDYFHRGAQFYIWNQKQKATNEIYSGLKLFPADPQLNALAGLLKKEEQKQQQQQQNQQQQQEQQQKEDQQQQNQQAQNQPQQNQSQKQQEGSQQNQQKKQDEQQQQAAKQSQEPPKKPSGQGANPPSEQSGETNENDKAAGEMTPEQARQLLDSQKGDEKILSPSREGKQSERRKALRDW
jgi:Ca-activated chloride channel family protein